MLLFSPLLFFGWSNPLIQFQVPNHIRRVPLFLCYDHHPSPPEGLSYALGNSLRRLLPSASNNFFFSLPFLCAILIPSVLIWLPSAPVSAASLLFICSAVWNGAFYPQLGIVSHRLFSLLPINTGGRLMKLFNESKVGEGKKKYRTIKSEKKNRRFIDPIGCRIVLWWKDHVIVHDVIDCFCNMAYYYCRSRNTFISFHRLSPSLFFAISSHYYNYTSGQIDQLLPAGLSTR